MGTVLQMKSRNNGRETHVNYDGTIMPIIPPEDMPKALSHIMSHIDYRSCGYSFYKGIIIGWFEEKIDIRIFWALDKFSPAEIEKLWAATYRKGTLILVWKELVPKKYLHGKDVDIFYNGELRDNWNIWSEVVSDNKTLPQQKIAYRYSK